MKYGKQTFAAALIAGGFFLFSGGLYAQDIHVQDTAAREAAFFRETNGTVETKAPGSAVWASAAAGDRIERNTIISTGFRSIAVIVLGDSVITVQPITRLSLEEIVRDQNDERVNLYLQTGRVRAEVKPPVGGKTDFTVRSPIATASVRGTSFDFDTENLRVDEGRVQYSHDNGSSTSVPAGGISYVDETRNTVISPFAAASDLLSPAFPAGSGSGSPLGDHAPAILNSPVILPPPLEVDVGIGFDWD